MKGEMPKGVVASSPSKTGYVEGRSRFQLGLQMCQQMLLSWAPQRWMKAHGTGVARKSTKLAQEVARCLSFTVPRERRDIKVGMINFLLRRQIGGPRANS
jgi:hypothetical protein